MSRQIGRPLVAPTLTPQLFIIHHSLQKGRGFASSFLPLFFLLSQEADRVGSEVILCLVAVDASLLEIAIRNELFVKLGDCVYLAVYVDEAGLEGYHDPFNRMPYPWGREDNNLINYFRNIGSIRRDNDVYKEGEFKLISLDASTLVFERYDEEHSYITFVNNSKQSKRVEFSSIASAMITNGKELSSAVFELAAYTAQIFKTKRNSYINF